MTIKRDEKRYPFLNGKWLDEFAEDLLKDKKSKIENRIILADSKKKEEIENKHSLNTSTNNAKNNSNDNKKSEFNDFLSLLKKSIASFSYDIKGAEAIKNEINRYSDWQIGTTSQKEFQKILFERYNAFLTSINELSQYVITIVKRLKNFDVKKQSGFELNDNITVVASGFVDRAKGIGKSLVNGVLGALNYARKNRSTNESDRKANLIDKIKRMMASILADINAFNRIFNYDDSTIMSSVNIGQEISDQINDVYIPNIKKMMELIGEAFKIDVERLGEEVNNSINSDASNRNQSNEQQATNDSQSNGVQNGRKQSTSILNGNNNALQSAQNSSGGGFTDDISQYNNVESEIINHFQNISILMKTFFGQGKYFNPAVIAYMKEWMITLDKFLEKSNRYNKIMAKMRETKNNSGTESTNQSQQENGSDAEERSGTESTNQSQQENGSNAENGAGNPKKNQEETKVSFENKNIWIKIS